MRRAPGFIPGAGLEMQGGMRGGVGSARSPILRAESSARERKMRNAACPCGAALLPAPAPARGTPPLSWGGFEWGPHGARAKARQPSTTLFCVAPSIQNDTPSTVQSGTARGVKISGGMEGGGGRAAGGDGDAAGGGSSARRSPDCRGWDERGAASGWPRRGRPPAFGTKLRGRREPPVPGAGGALSPQPRAAPP